MNSVRTNTNSVDRISTIKVRYLAVIRKVNTIYVCFV